MAKYQSTRQRLVSGILLNNPAGPQQNPFDIIDRYASLPHA
jgi:hypothetical protein